MKKLTSTEIRKMFLTYFQEKGHRIEPSASLVPKDDPTLLWINSGVATLKNYFDGSIVPDNPRIVNAQKSIRTNDIENVGYTARHHTFFEMLGNFSIGDYFKQEAIDFAWEFLTSEEWIGFDQELLTVTVHPEDDEAYDIWYKEIGLPEYRIIRLEENFWDIGEGPSGPNTEIFYDRGPSFGDNPDDPELYPGGENERYLEIWNLVFSEFNHNPDDTYTPLPNKNIDTGMGLERMASILQNVSTNFETDLFFPIINKVEEFANVAYGQEQMSDTAFKVIADHIRTVAFAIGDRALPSNEGRGYVLRRLIRRAIRFAKQIGIEKPFMYKLVSIVGNIMEDFYPEIRKQQDFIENIIEVEEKRFHETLNDGLDMLTSIIENEKNKKSLIFPGEEVFRLYDTYGFPKELTEEYVAEKGFSIDEEGFNKEMKKQQERARDARQQTDSMHVQSDLLSKITSDSQFIGYDKLKVKTIISAIISEEKLIDTANTNNEEIFLILDETPFYAESGGQVADSGRIDAEDGEAQIIDVQKAPKGQHIHLMKVEKGQFYVGQEVVAIVDRKNRQDVIKNHTATHLLHQALHDVIGDHVTQAGSLVESTRLRFDFTHYDSVTETELNSIEKKVNEKIWQAIDVIIETKKIEEAKEMGATALFGEKYGDIVRVVQINDFSIELCGGCHVNNTAEIGLFRIVSESGIGAGTRRIDAVTSKYAYEFLNEKINLLQLSSELLKTNQEQVPNKLRDLFIEIKSLEKENDSLSAKLSNIESSSIIKEIESIKDVKVLAQKVSVKNMNQLRNMVDDLRRKIDSGVILLATENEGKAMLAAGVSKDLIDRGLHAGNLIKQAAQICGGGGGGRPDMAQAGGKQPEKIDDALQFAKSYVEDELI